MVSFFIFQATISDSIRTVKMGCEEEFLKKCKEGIQNVDVQRLRQFDDAQVLHHGVKSYTDENGLSKFKKEAGDILEYTKDTCW